jgi:pSer/pThr/pTyr-binding forkhead associated (FHA) protein
MKEVQVLGTLTVYTLNGDTQLDQKEIRSDKHTITIGRHAERDLCILSPAISAEHAEVGWKDGKYWIMDLGSKHGTMVGNKPITNEPGWLKDGDIIILSNTVRIVFALKKDDEIEIAVVAEPDEPTLAQPAPVRPIASPPPLPTLASVAPPPPLAEATIASGPPLFDAGETTPVETLLAAKPKKKWVGKATVVFMLVVITAGIYASRHPIADFIKKNAATTVSTEDDSEGTMGAWLSGNERDGGIEIKLTTTNTVNDFLEKPSDMRQPLNPPDLAKPTDKTKATPAPASTKAPSKYPPGCYPYKIVYRDYWEAVMWAAGHDKNEKTYTNAFKHCNPGVAPHIFKDGDEIGVDKEGLTHDEVVSADTQIQAIKSKKKANKKSLDKDF